MKWLGDEFKLKPKYEHPLDLESYDLQICYNEYGGYCIPNSELQAGIVQRLMRGQIYEKRWMDFVEKYYDGGDIVHGGAYIGDFIPWQARLTAKYNAQAWSFEPHPLFARCSRITKLINGADNVNFFEAALSDKFGTATFQIHSHDGEKLSYGSRINESADNTISVDVQANSVDNLIGSRRSVAVLFFDLEGNERKALEGSMRVIKKDKPLIIVEDLPYEHDAERQEQWLNENLYSLGYEIIPDTPNGNEALMVLN